MAADLWSLKGLDRRILCCTTNKMDNIRIPPALFAGVWSGGLLG